VNEKNKGNKMLRKVIYGLMLGVVLFMSGCMEYTSPKPSVKRSVMLIKKREFHSNPSLKIGSTIMIDGGSVQRKKKVYLTPGKHNLSIRIFPKYGDKIVFYGIEEFFSLDIKENKNYVLYMQSDRRLPKKGKMPNLTFSIRENGRVILSRKMKSYGQAVADETAYMMVYSLMAIVL
jgi:hypothetical protein